MMGEASSYVTWIASEVLLSYSTGVLLIHAGKTPSQSHNFSYVHGIRHLLEVLDLVEIEP